MTAPEPFADTMEQRLAGYGDDPFVEFERTWYSGHDIADLRTRVDAALVRAGVAAGEPVGVVVRNRLTHAAAVLGFVATGRPSPSSRIWSATRCPATTFRSRSSPPPSCPATRR